MDPDKLEIIFHAGTRFSEDAAQHGGNGDNGRPHVETEAVAFEHGRFAAEPFVAFKQGDGVATGSERAGCREAAEAATDDADAFWRGCFHFVFCWVD